jgi:hypothetical protein
LITDIAATPDCVASRSLLPKSWPTEPTMVAPMATALFGVKPLLTEHLEGAQAILIFRVANLETAMKDH